MRQGRTCTGALTVTQACWHATLAVGPLCMCSSLTVQRPVLLPGPRAALFSQPKDLPAPGPLHALYPSWNRLLSSPRAGSSFPLA